jgi:ABC-2 type transport system permease protein
MLAIMRKDFAELRAHPSTLLTPLVMMLTFILPAFFIIVLVPAWSGEYVETSKQILLFRQFLLLTLMAPATGSMTLAAQAVISEKQGGTLEPLLATPLKTSELLAAKMLTPFLVALTLHLVGLTIYAAGIALLASPGILPALLTWPTFLLLFVTAPLVTLLSLQLAVIMSSRVNDARSAQQLGALVLLPVTGLFVAQLARGFVVDTGFLLVAIPALIVIDVALLIVGVRVFGRERILVGWK